MERTNKKSVQAANDDAEVNNNNVKASSAEDVVVEKPREIMFKKIGGGSFYLDRVVDGKKTSQIIKPGQKFKAYPEEIPAAFRDVVIAQESIQTEIQIKEVIKHVPVVYTLEPDGDGFNVVDNLGKTLNEKPLEKADALALISALNS